MALTSAWLEVITINKAAISAYQNIGFKTIKHYKCYNGILNSDFKNFVKLIQLTKEQFNRSKLPHQNNTLGTIRKKQF
jgi:transposase-like protein